MRERERAGTVNRENQCQAARVRSVERCVHHVLRAGIARDDLDGVVDGFARARRAARRSGLGLTNQVVVTDGDRSADRIEVDCSIGALDVRELRGAARKQIVAVCIGAVEG